MPDNEVSFSKVLMTEYERIKDEQRVRIGFRDNLLYVTLASLAAIIAATLTGGAPMLLLLPPVAIVLGWTYLVNDEKISAIGRYIRLDLGPRIGPLVGGQELFGWEVAHRSDQRRLSRKYLQLAVDLMTFCLSSAVAVVTYWVAGPATAILAAVSIVELIAVGVLAWEIVVYADLKKG
ncbi:hypothetical protein [Microbispora rosea]|uniref:hypothetical protein n=1 Tax=Microbispora rosea TaxID=58117 RepID=UPI003D94881A